MMWLMVRGARRDWEEGCGEVDRDWLLTEKTCRGGVRYCVFWKTKKMGC